LLLHPEGPTTRRGRQPKEVSAKPKPRRSSGRPAKTARKPKSDAFRSRAPAKKSAAPRAGRSPGAGVGGSAADRDAFRRARDYAEALVETVREALVVLDDQLVVRTANQAFYRTFQGSPGRTEGREFLELWRIEDSRHELRGLLDATIRDRAPIQDHEVTLEIEGLGTKTLLINARRVRLPVDTQPLILLAIDDITERKRAETALRSSESRYRRIFETAREGIWLMDAKTGQLIDVNPFLEELLGFSRREMLGRRPWDLGLYDDPGAARARFEANLAAGFGFEQEVMLRTKSGQRIYVEAITNTYDLGGRRVTQANLRDVTERARLQEQVRQMQKLDSIGRLAGGIAHDFNNLLNIISAHVALLGREKLEAAKRAESAGSIQKAVERGTAVVRQLLTFARKTDTAFEPTDVNAVVREVALMLRETFPKQVKVSTRLAEEIPCVHADPNQLHQAVLNLAVNARDAMPQGGVLTLGTDVVSVETLRAKFPEASGARYVEFCVADTGTGMDAETRRRIFEPFFSTKGSKGQGLGLAVVYGIVNSHRGYVDVESEQGKGTTFRVYVEVPDGVSRAEGPSPARRKSSRRTTLPPNAGPRGGSTLLLVEDEESLIGPIREFLEEEGYSVLTALDGLEAVRVHSENANRIAAVLLDLGLPRLGGWEAFLRMRERDPNLRCIVASGNIDAEQRNAMAEAGVQASVRKPYGSSEILRVVRQVLES
jgi:PAS domain S-box-containing protein